MSENTNPEQPEVPAPQLQPVPEAVREADAIGFAVYNRTLGQFVPGVSKDKPSQRDADKRVPEGHTAAVVRV
jgi:hypothetical protein